MQPKSLNPQSGMSDSRFVTNRCQKFRISLYALTPSLFPGIRSYLSGLFHMRHVRSVILGGPPMGISGPFACPIQTAPLPAISIAYLTNVNLTGHSRSTAFPRGAYHCL